MLGHRYRQRRLHPQVLPRGEKRRRPAPAARRHRRVVASLSYGWMGRTPDYKAAFGCALGANPAFYGQFEQNARHWYSRIQETGLYFNHAIVNPPIDRHKPADEVKDVYIKLEKETDAGIIVSGAKVVATNSALTHYNMIGFGSAQVMGENPDFALMFVAPMDAEGVKLISRASYELVAGATGSPYDYPLSSRFDENDAILVMDKVLIPWENVLIYRDFDRCRRWTMEGGFARMYPLQACVRLAVKLDFHHRPAEKIAGVHRHFWSSAACRRTSVKWWRGATCSGR